MKEGVLMPRKSISFELDFMTKDIISKFTVKQFDDVTFNITPLMNNIPYATTNMTGTIYIGCNNDLFQQNTDIVVFSDNINIKLNKAMLQNHGRAYAELELKDSNGVVTSSTFLFNIEKKIGEGATIPGSIEGFVSKYERLIAEFKSQVNETIHNCNSNVDNKLNTVDSLINVKISDFEKRFNRLTSSQQQDAEVIDARDGETSLKARLDRDIEKTNKELDRVKKLEESTVSTVTTESDFTTVEATSNGYFEDVKLEGKTLVNIAKSTTITLDDSSRVYAIPCGDFIQKGKTYTLFAKCTDYSLNGVSGVKFGNWELSGGTINDAIICKGVGGMVYKFTVSENATTTLAQVFIDPDNTEGSATLTDFVILEGDHTQNPPSYFEGLKSVGDGADEIVVESVNENLFDKTQKLVDGYISEQPATYGDVLPNNTCKSTDFILIDANTTYTLNNDNPIEETCGFYDATKKCITVVRGNTVTSPSNAKYVRCTIKRSDFEQGFQIVRGTQTTKYTPHQADKKRLLFYNTETQAWEKPILREWDSIEKHADGKYYYHQRSREVVLNGSESWLTDSTVKPTSEISTLRFKIVLSDMGLKYAMISSKSTQTISDKFKFLDNNSQYLNGDIEGICADREKISLNIAKSKLSTQDVAGFKQWLQTNNVTVVYQLAQEKVYECTNIDLITYANETNFIVNSGAIVPRTTLKVHNNISNVVRILQEKVSLLESNVKASQEVQDMMILETDMRMLDIELALMEFVPMKLNLGGSDMLRSATYFNFLKNHIINETYEKEYLENVMNKYLATGRINQDEYNELYKMLYPPVYDIELPIEY